MHIIRLQAKSDREAFIQAMWLLFLFAPSKPIPDIDGFYELGEIGNAPPKEWSRMTPYSLAKENCE